MNPMPASGTGVQAPPRRRRGVAVPPPCAMRPGARTHLVQRQPMRRSAALLARLPLTSQRAHALTLARAGLATHLAHLATKVRAAVPGPALAKHEPGPDCPATTTASINPRSKRTQAPPTAPSSP